MAKYIFVTGGVVSSLGKGIAAASIAKLLESRGLKVTLIKCDPYINVDPGTMNPFQHGEVYVTEYGAETDLDLGHYERFTKAKFTRDNNITTGKINIGHSCDNEYYDHVMQINDNENIISFFKKIYEISFKKVGLLWVEKKILATKI